MNNVIDVATGEVKVGCAEAVLASNGIGSCVAVVALDLERRIGGIAHVMLPGKAPVKEARKTKYASDALEMLLAKMCEAEAAPGHLKFFLVGGGNVLKIKGDTVCGSNIRSVSGLLRELGLKILKKSVGGNQRRTVRLDVSGGAVYYTKGSGPEKTLWKAK